MFSWKTFCDENSIEYNDRGKSTKRGNIYVWCPFCALEDHSKRYMGLSIDGKPFWGCWKTVNHSGGSPVRLIQALLRCSWPEAREEAGMQAPELNDWASMLTALQAHPDPSKRIRLKAVEMPGEAERADKSSWPLQYLRHRGFSHAKQVCRTYDLKFSISGRWQGRLLIPFYMHGKLVGWTGRGLSSATVVRYKTEPEGDVARSIIFNYDRAAEGGRMLVVTEGPLDGMKVDWAGSQHAIHAVSTLGLGLNDVKASLILDLSYRYDSTVIMLDYGAEAQSLGYQSALAGCSPRVLLLDEYEGDPGAMKADAIIRRLQPFL